MTGPEQRSLSPDGGTPEPETAALDGAQGPEPSERTGAAPHAPEAPAAQTGPPPARSFSPPPAVTAPHPQAHLAAPPPVHRSGGSLAYPAPSASPPPPGIPPRSDPLPPPRATGAGAPRTGSLPPRVPQRPAGAPAAGASSPGAAARPATSRGRRARLTLRRIDPWSVFLFSVVASIFLGLALLAAAFVLYTVLSSLGVIDSLNTLIGDVTADPGETAEPSTALTGGRILGVAAVIAAFNVVLLTALATLSAFLYNLCAALTGGIEVTFGDRE